MLPLPRELTRAQWVRRGIIWLAWLSAFVLLVQFDVLLMRWRFLVIRDEPSGGVRQLLFGLRDFGQVVPMVAAMVIVYLSDRRRMYFIVTLLFAQLLVAAMCQPIKWSLPRYRPHAAIAEVAEPRALSSGPVEILADAANGGPVEAKDKDYAGLLGVLRPGDTWMRSNGTPRSRETRYEAFPSGHSAAAFAFAAILAWFYPHLRWVWWALACGCAVSRYVDAVHWPSDCLAGAAIGYVAGWMALRPYAWVLPVILVRRRVKRRQKARRRSIRAGEMISS
mgnify:CR=1 FL=1